MNLKSLGAAILIAAFATPAFADFYVVQDVSTKKCTVVEQKPTSTTSVVVSPSGKVYTTRNEADQALQSITVCQSK